MPINEKPDDQIRLTDLGRASIILAQGIPMVDVETTSRGTLVFIFDNTDDRAKIASAAVMNNVAIPIRTYLESVQKLKEILTTHIVVTRSADKAAEKAGKSIGRDLK